MKNFYFDLCSIPIYLLIIWFCHSRKMDRGQVSRVFSIVNFVSLICAVLSVLMEFVVNPLPLSSTAVVFGTAISFLYKLLRNSTLVVNLIFLFMITHTENRLRAWRVRFVLWFPNAVLVVILIQNFFTQNVFSVSAENGYSRGPLLIIFYIIALIYWAIGVIYCIQCKKLLDPGKWMALMSVYFLIFVGVIIQFIWPKIMLEMFSTAIGLMIVMLMVMRPEESLDGMLTVRNWRSYQNDLANILLSRDKAQFIVIQMVNAADIRTYMGEERYNEYLQTITDEIRKLCAKERISVDIYLERPGTVYLIPGDPDFDAEGVARFFLEKIQLSLKSYSDAGIRFDPVLCLIRYPDDLSDAQEILNLGHKFPQFGKPGQIFFRAEDIVSSRDFAVVNHMDEILNRVITHNSLEMYYQPIFDLKTGKFSSAEALARINDPEFGMISPALFIPAAEATGVIIKLGERVLEQVFQFVSEQDLPGLGLDYIEINLSVSQMLQHDLPEIISRLQRRYNVLPGQINFEVTETIFDNISEIMEQNVLELTGMGYSFSLDDYGTGYSNIQRLSRLPIHIIKIDKSLVDDIFTETGNVILVNTVRMMQGIHKELVVEGVETKEALDILTSIQCDFIQGYYYSRPLPACEFIKFLMENNQ